MAELIHKLGIDGKLLVAQAVNFLILLWLLKKFLYRPILELLRNRRAVIEESARNADRIAEELWHIEQRKAAELEQAKRQADALIQEAKRAAKERGDELLQGAEAKIVSLIDEAKRHIEEERVKMMDEAGKDIKELVFMVAEKVLQERLPHGTHERFVQEAIRQNEKFKNQNAR